ncbi:subtilisin-like protease SBT1.4 [Mercurialis annua]|uniref:subtilisin-like protease SBT1.4 n=1 Tax=Mercurialis annua TaxID=3986 RepID=UPI00215E7228|nr:subtilisin-like protease SBT1.4 [Mercurialis annua]
MASSSISFLHLLLFFVYFTSVCLSSPLSNQPKTFIIHTSNSHKPTLFTSHHDWYHSFINSIPSPPHHQAKILYTYSHAVNGFSAHLTPSQASILRGIPGIISVIPDQIRQLHTTHTPHFLGLSSDTGLWPNSAYGDDVIIGVLDTGIWPGHPSFSDNDFTPVPDHWKGVCETSADFPVGSCNKKLIGARAYNKGYLAYQGNNINKLTDSRSPRDTEGHGTHTASTAGGSSVSNASLFHYAQGEARGMASKARIAAYKICWSFGCYDSDILAAMDQAISDGVHIISLSVGANGYAPQYDHDSIAIGAFGATQHGIVVSCSAGNSGPGSFTAVNIAPWILTVGASTVDREFPADVVLGDGSVFGGVSLYFGESLPDFKLPLVYSGDVGNRYCLTGSLNPSKVQGKIVVCDRGLNARVEKGSAVKLAGGLGMILANTDDIGEELIADSHLIPATTVGAIAGDKIREYTKLNQNPTATIVFHGTVIGSSPSAPQVASFSSRGPNHVTPEILKPDVIAPGVNILAGWTGASAPTDLEIDPRRVQFNIISGTSMSCPHVSGIAALLRKAYPNWSPAAIKSALMTTAYNLDNSGKNIVDLATGKESTPFVRGAGHVDPNSALDPGLVYDIETSDYISFLCSIGYDSKRIAVFVGEAASSDICDKKLTSPGNLNYPSFSVVLKSDSDVVTYKRVVKIVGSSLDAVYKVRVNAPENIDIKVSPSTLVFSPENQSLSYEITFSSSASLGWSSISQTYGSIEWSDGSHIVRSAIAVKWQQGQGEAKASI